jgi:hypothetical protein
MNLILTERRVLYEEERLMRARYSHQASASIIAAFSDGFETECDQGELKYGARIVARDRRAKDAWAFYDSRKYRVASRDGNVKGKNLANRRRKLNILSPTIQAS